jgi:hypothetical protein
MNDQLALQNEQMLHQQEQVDELTNQLAAHEADARVLCGLYDSVVAEARKEVAQAMVIVASQSEKLATQGTRT